jgi:hypothetical protein
MSFGTIKGFPLVPAGPNTGYGPQLGLDNTNSAVYLSAKPGAGWVRLGPSAFNTQLIASAATATGASMFTAFSMPAGMLNVVGKTWTIYGSGQYVIATSTPTMSIALIMGSTTIGTLVSAATTNGATNNLNFSFTVTTQTAGTTGTDYVSGDLSIVLGATSTTAAATDYIISGVAASTGWDHTAAANVTVVPTFAGASNTFQLTQLYLAFLN